MNSLFSHYDKTVSRRLSRHPQGQLYYGKRRPSKSTGLSVPLHMP
jgi:hypothetical protein